MRSLWIGTLAVALSCSAPGWGQLLQPDRWIMVREEGKPAVKCRVVTSKKQKDGSSLCQARTEAGEMITLLEEPIPGKPSGMTRLRILSGTGWTTSGRPPGVPQPAASFPTPSPTPTSTPALKPVPPPTVMPAVVRTNPESTKEATKEKPTLFNRLFHSTPAKPEVVKANEKKEAVGRDSVLKSASEIATTDARPKLPLSTTSTDDPLSRPDLYTKSSAVGPEKAAPLRPVKQAGLFDRMFNRTETPVVSETPPPSAAKTRSVTESQPVGSFPRMQPGSPPRKPVEVAREEVTPSVADRLRAQIAMRQAAAAAKTGAKPIDPRTGLPMGLGSVVAVRDRAIMGQSSGGAMVRTPTGAMAYIPPEYVGQGSYSVPVSASNAFTLSMPGAAMQGGMPMLAQAPVAYDQGIPEGAANAFTRTSTTRPIPSDFGPTPQNPNAFLIDGMGGAYARPMAMGYDPRMGYVPVGGGYPQAMQMVPTPRPSGQMLAVLRGSIMPSEREQAVALLSRCDWHADPEAVAAIMIAAKSDPAPMVRVSCVKALARMKVNSMPAFDTLMELKRDKDQRVRQEAEQTLATMTRH